MHAENIGRPRAYKVPLNLGFECLWRFKIQAMGYQPPHFEITLIGNVFFKLDSFFLFLNFYVNF
jgi:hypothetical protein